MRNVNQQPRDHSFLARYGSIIAKGGIAAIPSALYRYQGELKLKPQIVWFISAILTHKWDADMPSPSLRKMAGDTGVSRQQLHNYKTELETEGWLVVINRDTYVGGKDSNYYDFTALFAKLEELLIRDAKQRQEGNGAAETGEENTLAPYVNPSLHTHVNPVFHTPDNPSLHGYVNAGLPLIESVLEEPDKEINISNIRKRSHANFSVHNAETHSLPPSRTGSAERESTAPITSDTTSVGEDDTGSATAKQWGMEVIGEILKKKKGRPTKQEGEEREMIKAFIRDFAREFHDQAELKSSVSRAFNIYKESGLSPVIFQARMYQARLVTKDYQSRSRIKGSVMAYYFSVLEDQAGLKDDSHQPTMQL